jgi:hypothetical protein
VSSPSREYEAESTAGESEERALGEDLTDDAPAGGAKGEANAEFLGAGAGAGEQKVRDVDAGDEEDEADGGEKHNEDGLNVTDDCLAERPEAGAEAAVGLWKGGSQMIADVVHVGLGLRQRDTGFQAGNAVNAEARAAQGEGFGVPLADGEVDVLRDEGAELEIEGGGDDTDNGVIAVVEGDGTADDVGIGGKLASPESAAEHGDGRAADFVFAGREKAAEDRLDAEELKEIGSDEIAAYAFCVSIAGHDPSHVAKDGDAGEAAVVALPVAEVRVRDGAGLEVGLGGVDGEEVIGAGRVDGVKQDGVDDGEERRVDADAEGQSDDDDGGEAG